MINIKMKRIYSLYILVYIIVHLVICRKMLVEGIAPNTIKSLQEIQKTYGYLPRAELERLSKLVGVPLSKIFGIATFYHQFRLDKPGKVTIYVCMGTACHLRGNAENYEFLRKLLKIPAGKSTSEDGMFSLEKVRCFGCCSLAPVVKIGDKLVGHAKPPDLQKALSQIRKSIEQKVIAQQKSGGERDQ